MYPKRLSKLALTRAVLLSSVALLAMPAFAGDFTNVGPAPVEFGTNAKADNIYTGAVNAIVTDPTNAKRIYAGSVNGGVWGTTDGGTTWTPLTDHLVSLSIDSLSADPTDATYQTLIAGTGIASNGGAEGGQQAGLLYTKDGGTTWSQLGATTFAGQSVAGVAARGSTIVAGTYDATGSVNGYNTGALYRSTDGGTTFTKISGGAGLALGPVSAIVGDPTDTTKLYAAVTAPDTTGAGLDSTAVYVSTDTGATWTKVFGTANAGGTINTSDQTFVRLATGPGGAVAAVVGDLTTGKLVGVYLSKNSGATWQTLPVPNVNTGGQANTNLAVGIDPNNTNYVYVTGDTISASPYTVTAYRIDATTNTATSITGTNTADGTSAHADSRAIAFDSKGNLILATDGAMYSRSQPQSSAGSWTSLAGNMSTIEAYQAVYGAHAGLVGVAAQDNGASLQTAKGSTVFNDITSGDGFDVSVNDTTLSGKSVYYLAANNLGMNRVVVDSTGTITANQTVTFASAPAWPLSTPLVLNRIDPTLMAIGGKNIYISQDTLTGADAPGTGSVTLNLTKLGGNGNQAYALAYGTKDNTNALLAGLSDGSLWMSTSNAAGSLSQLTNYAGNIASSLVFDPRTQQRFFVADSIDLWDTTNQGTSFQKLTANLPTGLVNPRSVEFISNNGVDALLVGGNDNAANVQSTIAVADSSSTGVLSGWRFFGSGLPNAPVNSLSYNPLVDVLTVATFGRGAWLMYDVTSHFSSATVLQFGLANNDSTPDATLLTGARPLIKYGTGTLLITGAGTYTGGTTINAGTLQLGNGGTGGSILGDVTDNGLFTINRSNAYTFAGSISGSGRFTQAGAGTTSLTGTNSFTGGTTVSAGMLQIGAGGSTGSLAGNVVDNALFAVNRSNAYSFAGVISGSGGFIQAGSGDTTLTGTSTYSGATSVNAGTLSVNGSIASSSGVAVANGGTLGGTGTVPTTSVASGGTLAPGNSIGTLTVNGNFTLAAGSTYLDELSPSASDKLLVSGTAAINGHLVLAPSAGSYMGGTSYTLINSTGALTGNFSDVVVKGSFGAFMPTVSYDANDVFVTLSATGALAWRAAPGSSDWNTASNWTTNSVPTATDTAEFNTSTQTSIDIQKANTQVAALQFNAGAPAYTFNVTGTAAGTSALVIGGAGIVDNSGNAPSFVVGGVIGNTGTLQFNNSASAGDASITANGFGNIVFTGMSDAGSARLIAGSGGTVDISGLATTGMTAGSIAGAGSFVLGAKTLAAGHLNTDTTVSGVISGVGGWLNKTGTGTLTLTGADTYSGGTMISAGTLQIGDGGTSGSLASNVTNNSNFVIDRSNTLSFGHVISGTGTLTQSGSGMTILTATNTYTGATTIAAGTLQVDGSIAASSGVAVKNGGTLQGSGTVAPVTVASGGALAPGAGVGGVGHLSVTGNTTLNAGSNLEIDTGTAGTDLLSVTGALRLAGTVRFNATSAIHYGDTAVFGTASTVTGAFASVPDTIPGVLYPSVSEVATATGKELVVTMKAGSFLSQFTNGSADVETIATALDSARAAHYTDLKTIYDSVDTLTDGRLTTALAGLAPTTARALPSIVTHQMGGFTNLIWNHLADLGANESGSGGTAFNVDTSALGLARRDLTPFSDANTVLAFGRTVGAAAAGPATVTPAQATGGGWTRFAKGVSGFFSGSSLDGSVAIGGGAGKARLNGYLVAAGLDVQAGSHVVFGGAFSYADSTAKISTGPGQVGSTGYQGVAYARYDGDGWFVDGFAGSGSQSLTTTRSVVAGTTTFKLRGRTNATSPTFGVSAGMPFVTSDITVTPAAGLQWLDTSVDAYTETGGAPAMAYRSASRKSFTGRLGFDAVGNFTTGGIAIKPLVHAYLVHDFESGPSGLTTAFTSAPTVLMTFAQASRSQTWGELGIGARAALSDAVSLSVRYDTTVGRSDLTSGAWTGRLDIKF